MPYVHHIRPLLSATLDANHYLCQLHVTTQRHKVTTDNNCEGGRAHVCAYVDFRSGMANGVLQLLRPFGIKHITHVYPSSATVKLPQGCTEQRKRERGWRDKERDIVYCKLSDERFEFFFTCPSSNNKELCSKTSGMQKPCKHHQQPSWH